MIKKILNILYIGDLHEGTTTSHRMQALKNNGYKVVEFDADSYIRGKNRILNSISHRFDIGPYVSRYNKDLMELTQKKLGPIDVIWIDKGKWLSSETLQLLKNHFNAVTVHYTPDPQLVAQKSQAFLSCIPLYDLMLTTKPYEVPFYKKYGVKNLQLINQSYDSLNLHPRTLTMAQKERFSADVGFIGHCENHYQFMLQHVVKAGVNTKIWGPNWHKNIVSNKYLKSSFSGDGVWGEDYGLALNGVKIGLCLLTKRWPETTTTRTFEIPGSGTFMLAERTEDHQSLFKEGVEADFFSTQDELIDKIQYYLKNDSVREKIALAGYQRSKSSKYDNHSLMGSLMEEIKKEFLGQPA